MKRAIYRCERCRDTGVWLTPMGVINECPKLQLSLDDHVRANDAAQMILRAGRHLSYRGIVANPLAFEVAVALTRHSTLEPCTRQELIDRHFQWATTKSFKREVCITVEQLRSVWLLPVASRKQEPHGYWIATEEADFKRWVDRAKSAPLTQLSTIHAVARANFPVFAEQLELEFSTSCLAPYATVSE